MKKTIFTLTMWCLIIIATFAGSVAAQFDNQRLPASVGMDFQRNVKYFSESGNHYLIFQDDGDFVVYDKNNRLIWGVNQVSNDFRRAARADFNLFGVFGLYDAQGKVIWSPPVESGTAAFLTIRENGSLQLIAKDGNTLWSSDGNNASNVKVPPGNSGLDLKTNLLGTWSNGSQKFVASQDKISFVYKGKAYSVPYTITGKNTIVIETPEHGKQTNTISISEERQGAKPGRILSFYDDDNTLLETYKWESDDTQVKDSNTSQKTPAKPANTPSNEPKKPEELKNPMIGTWVLDLEKSGPNPNFDSLLGNSTGKYVIDGNGKYFFYSEMENKENKLEFSGLYQFKEKNCFEFLVSRNRKMIRCVDFVEEGNNRFMVWTLPVDEFNVQFQLTRIVFKLESDTTDVNFGDSLNNKIIGLWGGVSGTNSENHIIHVYVTLSAVPLSAETQTFEEDFTARKSQKSIQKISLTEYVNKSTRHNRYFVQQDNKPLIWVRNDLRLKEEIKVSVDGDTMTVTDDKGVQKKYNRLKSMDSASKFVF